MVLYTRDVMNITGRSRRTAYRLMQKIRHFFGKSEAGFVTLKEFCIYCEMEEEEVMKYLKH